VNDDENPWVKDRENPHQDAPDKTLIVNGAAVNAAVVRVQGRSYVDIEGLAQAIGGSVTFEPNQITLTIPAPPRRQLRGPRKLCQRSFSRWCVRFD